jgi:VWFA-related protein
MLALLLPQDAAEAPTRQVRQTVVDASGEPVRGLTARDFLVEESGVPQPILGFSTETGAAVSLGFLIDTSYSMSGVQVGASPLRSAGVAARVFIRSMKAGDEIGLMSFSNINTLTVERALTDDRAELDTALSRIRDTSLNVAARSRLDVTLREAAREMRSAMHRSRALVVMTDGFDLGDLDDLTRELVRSEVPVYLIVTLQREVRDLDWRSYSRPSLRYGDDEIRSAFPFMVSADGNVTEWADLPEDSLQTLLDGIEATGGRSVLLENRWPDQLEGLLAFIELINADLRGQYLISYRAVDPDGTLPFIRVRTTDPDHRVRVLETTLVSAESLD